MNKKDMTNIPDCENCTFRKNNLLCDLSLDSLEEISYAKTHVLFKKGQIIFHEGNIAQGLYCIYKGKVKIHKWDGDGKEQIIRLAQQNQVIGYRALLNGEPYNATATTLTDSLMCFIPKKKVMEMLHQEPRFSRQALKLLTNDLKFAEEKTVNFSHKHIRERVADALLLMIDQYGLMEDKETIGFTLTRREIAGMSGTTTESAIRVISDFHKEGILEVEGKKIKVKDLQKLKQTSEPFV